MDARLSMQTSINGGSSETDEKALTVMPPGLPSSYFTVTTVTPLAKRPSAARNSSLLTGIAPLRQQATGSRQKSFFAADCLPPTAYCFLYLFISSCKPLFEPLWRYL